MNYGSCNETAERAIGKVKEIMRCLIADRSLLNTHWPLYSVRLVSPAIFFPVRAQQ